MNKKELDPAECNLYRRSTPLLDVGDVEKVFAQIIVGDLVRRFVVMLSKLTNSADVALLTTFNSV